MTNEEEEPLAACHDCGLVGNEKEVSYLWDDYGYDEPICYKCHSRGLWEERPGLYVGRAG